MDAINFSIGEPAAQSDRWPFRLAVLAEFLPRVFETGKPEKRAFRFGIDKDNFGEVMTKAGLRAKFELKNPLGDSPKEWRLDLPLTEIKSFRPDNLVVAIPELADLVAVRKLMDELAKRKINVTEFKTRIKKYRLTPELSEWVGAAVQAPQKTQRAKPAPPAPRPPVEKPSAASEKSIDSILDMVDIGEDDTSSADTQRQVQAALDDFLGAGKKPGDKFNPAAAQKGVAYLDALLSRAVNTILHHPEFKRLEAVWTGLKFLIDQTDFRKNVQLEIISTSPDQLLANFDKYIYQVEYEAQSATPLAAALIAFEFGTTTADTDLLRKLTQKANEIPLSLLTAVGLSFFGLEESTQFRKLPFLASHLEGAEYTKFNGLREDDASRWLVVGFNRFMLRYPYGSEGRRVKAFDFTESIDVDHNYLWGNPAWLIASTLTRSHARVGWATEIAGRQRQEPIDNLPVRAIKLANGEESNIPLEVPLPDPRLEEFNRCGIIPLICDPNSDAVYLLPVPTAHRPRHDSDLTKAEINAFMASLPYQMYAGEIARFINRHFGELTSGTDGAAIEAGFAAALKAFNVVPDEPHEPGLVKVTIEEHATKPGHQQLALQIRSPQKILHGRAGVQMALPLRW